MQAIHQQRRSISCSHIDWHFQWLVYRISNLSQSRSEIFIANVQSSTSAVTRSSLIIQFCVTVGPSVTRTADILSPSGRGLYASLIGFNPRRLKVLKKAMSTHATDLAVYAKSSCMNLGLYRSDLWTEINKNNFKWARPKSIEMECTAVIGQCLIVYVGLDEEKLMKRCREFKVN